MSSTEYAHPEALVNTEWVAEHLKDPKVRIIESNEDVLLYDTGHIPGAVHVDWRRDLNDQTVRDYINPKGFAELASRIGVTPVTTVVFYGDKSNWWATYALWVFSLFGHKDLRIVNGGRDKWIAEKREVTRQVPKYAPSEYPVPAEREDGKIRAFYEEALEQSKSGKPLIDVRSPGEFKGEITHMPSIPRKEFYVVDMSHRRKAFPGRRLPKMMEHSSRSRNSRKSTLRTSDLIRLRRWLFTAESVNDRATLGLS
jgi:thiosulfate/3-mercaptopyruvate sulfurtransferase